MGDGRAKLPLSRVVTERGIPGTLCQHSSVDHALCFPLSPVVKPLAVLVAARIPTGFRLNAQGCPAGAGLPWVVLTLEIRSPKSEIRSKAEGPKTEAGIAFHGSVAGPW